MSRTYNQDPRHVAILRHGTPIHDHSRGECDLEEYRAYLRAHGENKGSSLRPGEHKGCAKVMNIYYVNCWHAPSRGPYVEGFSHVEDETAPGGFTMVRYVKDRPVEPSYNPSLRHFLRRDGGEWVRAHVTDEPLASLGEVPPCTTGYARYNSSALNWSGPGNISLRHYGFTIMEETEMGDFLHCYYLKVVDMDVPCACDAPRPGWRFSCSLELSPVMEYGAYKPRYCTCLYCVGEPISEKRSRRRAMKASLDNLRHGVNSGYDVEDWDVGCSCSSFVATHRGQVEVSESGIDSSREELKSALCEALGILSPVLDISRAKSYFSRCFPRKPRFKVESARNSVFCYECSMQECALLSSAISPILDDAPLHLLSLGSSEVHRA